MSTTSSIWKGSCGQGKRSKSPESKLLEDYLIVDSDCDGANDHEIDFTKSARTSLRSLAAWLS